MSAGNDGDVLALTWDQLIDLYAPQFDLTGDQLIDLYNAGHDLIHGENDAQITGMAKRLLRQFAGDLAIAFVLGAWVNEVVNSLRTMNGRKRGQPLAAKARRKLGRESRKAVIAAARAIHAENGWQSASETARQIERKKLDALRKKDGTYLGAEAIAVHLRAARRTGQLKIS